MNTHKLIDFLTNTFPMLKVEDVNQDDMGSVGWSMNIEDREELDMLYDKLYSLESYFNHHGYKLTMQDDPDYFGAVLKK